MKRTVLKIIAVIILIAGMLIFFFPLVSQWLFERNVNEIVKRFEEDINIDETDPLLEELYQLMVRENIRLYEEGQKDLVDPFSYEKPGIDLTKYGIRDNCVGYLVLPAIDEKLPIYLGASKENMELGAVHLTETSYPVGGNNTNSVIAAHRGHPRARMFRYIDQLSPDDEVYIVNFRETLKYRVFETKIIQPNEVDQILIKEDKDMITLISCNPYGYNYQRIIVYCERILQ